MRITLELTHRLAEMAGFHSMAIELAPGSNLRHAISRIEEVLSGSPALSLVPGGRLHPSILVVCRDRAFRPSDDHAVSVSADERIRLLLPIAGG